MIALLTAWLSITLPAREAIAQPESSEIAEIKRVYERITRAVESKQTAILQCFNAGDGWNRLESQGIDQDKIKPTDKTPLQAATLYLQGAKVIRIVDRHADKTGITLRSYYFYDNANVAYIFERRYIFATDSGANSSFIVESKIYFSINGDEIERKVTYLRKPEEAMVPPAPEIQKSAKEFEFYPLVESPAPGGLP